MESLFEQMGGTYSGVGDYLLPDLDVPTPTEAYQIGNYGRMRLHYLKEHRRALYIYLLTSGRLYDHLHEVECRATKQAEEIINAMAKADGCDESLKARDQMRWVGLMNNYRQSADEVVMNRIIFNSDS